MTIQTGSIEYIRAVLSELGLKPSALAKRAGIATTTLTRALNSPDHKFALSTTTLSKIAKSTGISPAPFLSGVDQVELAARAFFPATSFDPKLFGEGRSILDKETRFSAVTAVIGAVSAGKWQDPTLAATEHPPLDITIPGLKPRDVFACYVEGASGEPAARHGEYVVCVRLEQHDISVEPSLLEHVPFHIAVVERRNLETFRIELTCQLLRYRRNTFELIQFSPQNWRDKISSIRFSSLEEKIDPRILGIVVHVVRPPLTYDLVREINSNLA